MSANPPKRILDRHDLLALSICFLSFSLWLWLLNYKYYTFGYWDWDLAFFSQVMWNLSFNGSPYSSLFDKNFLGNHSNFIAYLLIPVYRALAHPMTLVVLKVISYVSGSYVLYRFAKERVGAVVGIVFLVLYLVYPPNLFGIIYEFDFESLVPVFIFLLYISYQKEKLTLFLILALLTVLIKENMPLVIVCFGFAALFSKRKQKWAWVLLPIALGLCVSHLFFNVLIPHFAQSPTHPYSYLYSRFGRNPLQILQTLLTHPGMIFESLTATKLNYFEEILGPLALTPLFSPLALFLGSPLILQRLLANTPQQHTIYYQYVISLAPFLFLSSVTTLAFIRRKYKIVYKVTIILMVLSSLQYLYAHKDELRARIFLKEDGLHFIRWEMVESIPSEATVMSSFDFLAALSQRRDLYAFYKAHHFAEGSWKPFVLPQGSYALIDFDDSWLRADFSANPQKVAQKIHAFIDPNEWNVLKAYGEIVLLQKEYPRQRLLQIAERPTIGKEIITADKQLKLLSVEKSEQTLSQDQPTLPLTFSWQAEEDIADNYIMRIYLQQGGHLIAARTHRIGYCVFPTSLWRKGQYINESYWFLLTGLLPGEYSLDVELINEDRNQNNQLFINDLVKFKIE